MERFDQFLDTAINLATFLAPLVSIVLFLHSLQEFSQVVLFILLNMIAVSMGLLTFKSMRKSTDEPPHSAFTFNHKLSIFTSILIFTFIFSAILVSLHHSSFYRDITYHILSSTMILFLLLQILQLSQTAKSCLAPLILGEILLFSYMQKSSAYLLNMYPTWYDGFFHYFNSLSVLDAGRVVPELGPYVPFPLHHIRNAELLLVSGMPSVLYLAVVNLANLIVPLSIYLIMAKFVKDLRWALVAALLSSITFFMNSSGVSSHNVAFSLAPSVIYLLVRATNGSAVRRSSALVLLLGLSVLLEHPTIAFILSLMLLADALLSFIRSEGKVLKVHFLAYTLLVVAYIMYAAESTFNSFVVQLFLSYRGPPFAPTLPQITPEYVAQLMFKYLPYPVFTFLFIIGALIILTRSSKYVEWLFVASVVLIIAPCIMEYAIGRPLTELLTLAYYPVLMSLAGTFAVINLAGRKKCLVLLVLLLVTAQLSLSLNNDDNLYFLKPYAPQFNSYQNMETKMLRVFIDKIPPKMQLIMDYGSGASHWYTENFIKGGLASLLSENNILFEGSYIVYNPGMIRRWQAVGTSPQDLINKLENHTSSGLVNIFCNNGELLVYLNV